MIYIVYNLIWKDGIYYYYSIIRADGYDAQKHSEKKKCILETAAINAQKKGLKYYEASKEGADFLRLGEPIKIGHHSEKKHRALIERNHERFGKYIECEKKADDYKNRAKFWESKEDIINLSMPESLTYFEEKLKEAKKIHLEIKNQKEKREHSFSLTYAKKNVNDFEKKAMLAKKLWA